MKKISILILVLVAAMTSCKKTPEVNLKYVDVERDLVTVGMTTANIQCDYNYIATLKKAYLYYGEGEDESDFTSAEMRVVQNTLYVELMGLKSNTTYNYYYEFHNGFNSMRTALKSFKTEVMPGGVTLPTVITAEVTEITTDSAKGGGEVTDDGGVEVTERGVCWSTNVNPSLNNSHVAVGMGMGAFVAIINGLESNTTYHVRAYAINEAGTAYGLDREFTTLSEGGGGGPTQDEYLTIESIDDDNTITLNIPSGVNSQCLTSVSYSTDGTTWTTLDIDATDQTISVTLNRGGSVCYKGLGRQYAKDYDVYSYFTTSGNINVFGNIMSLLYGDDFANATAFPTGSSYTFYGLFRGTDKLISAGNLILPATSLVFECYRAMFRECTSLTETPVLPAIILAYGCYMEMFMRCNSLMEVPVLPATTMARGCYYCMFYECISLTEAPVLPATTLAEQCYRYMFYGCTSLTEAPDLPATVLSEGCYCEMFRNCTSLTRAPALPATTLTIICYDGMFSQCTSLTEPPALPATILAYGCYGDMFSQCTSLTKAPALPATTLAESCYHTMFAQCFSLTEAPVLPATTLAIHCYQGMFNVCFSLEEVTCLATDISATDCTDGWLYGVPSGGTFRKNAAMNDWPLNSDSGIPSGWNVVDY